MHRIKLAVNPLSWMNSDFPEVGAGMSVERCLSEAALAGYSGVELEDPMRAVMDKLPNLLHSRGLKLVAAWHSCHLLENGIQKEMERLKEHLDLLYYLDSNIVNLGECSFSVHRDPSIPLSQRPQLNEAQWDALCSGLSELHTYAASQGFTTAFHHHMGSCVQSKEDIDALMDDCEGLGLLFDTGHLLYAGADPLQVLNQHIDRITHVHLKNVRTKVLGEKLMRDSSFHEAVMAGVFTVPGDGGYDFQPIIDRLIDSEYSGWLVVEAEQDPGTATPFPYVKLAYHSVSANLAYSDLRSGIGLQI